MVTPHWQHFEHKAYIGVRGFGNEPAEAFEQAALAMSAIITDLSLVEVSEEISIICEQADQAGLSRMVAKLEPLICIKG